MIRFSLLLMLGVGLLGPSLLPAQAVRPPFSMNKQYSAEVSVVMKDGMTINTKVFADGDKMRSETQVNDMKMATIIRKDKSKIYNIMIAQKMIVEMDLDETKYKGMNAAAFGPDGKFELIGPDVVNGVTYTKYKVTSDKTHQIFFFWLDTVNQAPVKMEAQDRSFTVSWHKYVAGPQDPNLFELPSGYQVMSMQMPDASGPPPDAAPGGDPNAR
jgi:hypothetical protein